MGDQRRLRTTETGKDDRVYDDELGVVRSFAYGFDLETDRRLNLTDRQLARLVIVATETAERFVREHLEDDPVCWMYSSLRLCQGRQPVDACSSRDTFLSALVLHGIFKADDADPEDMQAFFRSRPS